jgi:hypothetical protein
MQMHARKSSDWLSDHVRDEELAIQSKKLASAYAHYRSVLRNSFAQTASLTLTWHFSVITRLDIALRPRFRRFSINSEKRPVNSGNKESRLWPAKISETRSRHPIHHETILLIALD